MADAAEKHSSRIALPIVGTYAAVSCLWILLSDHIVKLLFHSPALVTRIQTYKGIFFIVITAGLLFLLIRRAASAVQRALDQAQRSEHALRDLIENSPLPMLAVEDGGRVSILNRKFTETFGYTIEDIPDADHWWPLAYPDLEYRNAARREWQKILGTQTTGNTMRRYRVTAKNSQELEVEFRVGRLEKWAIVILTDVTRRQQLEQDLRHAEEWFRNAFDLAAIGRTMVAYETGRFLRVNPAICQLLGYSVQEVLNMTWYDVVTTEQIDECQRNITRLGQQEIPSVRLELQLCRHDGARVWTEVNTVLIRNRQGTPQYLLSDIVDINERKKAEEALRQSEKMQAIGQLAGGIAHDFNNQLGGIIGYAEMLALHLSDPIQKGFAETIVKTSLRAADLTQKLLAFARKGKYLSVPVDLNMIMQEVVTLLQRSVDKRVQLQIGEKAGSAIVNGDPTQLQNMLLNMALNARDAMPEGGALTLSTRNVILDEAFCRRSPFHLRPGGYLALEVRDTGIGMSADVRERIFEPFFTTKPAGEGTGMGLAAVYGAVTSHRGAISVASSPGEGTCFTIHFPLASRQSPSLPMESESVPPVHAQRSVCILLVDDEQVILHAVGQMLSDLGYQVITCSDGKSAVERYRKQWRGIGLIILDMVMPELDGTGAFQEFCLINPEVRIVLCSGFSLNDHVQALLNRGALGFLQKPFTVAKLARVVDDAVNAPSPTTMADQPEQTRQS